MNEPQPETSAATHGVSAVHSADALTLVCLVDGSEVRVSLSAAARESELVRTLLDDVEEASPRLDLHELDEAAAVAFAVFLEVPATKMRLFPLPTAHPDSGFLGDGPRGFVALYAAADYLIALRWRAQLADAWLAALATATPLAVTRAVEVADAAVDPAVSPLLAELPAIDAVGRFYRLAGLPLAVAHFAKQELARRSRVVAAKAKDADYEGDNALVHAYIADGTTEIGDYAFANCESLISIVIPDSVTSIGRSSFDECSSLAAVHIGDSVTSIGLCLPQMQPARWGAHVGLGHRDRQGCLRWSDNAPQKPG